MTYKFRIVRVTWYVGTEKGSNLTLGGLCRLHIYVCMVAGA